MICETSVNEIGYDMKMDSNRDTIINNTETQSTMSKYDIAFEIWERNNYDIKLSQQCDADHDISRFVGYLFFITHSGCLTSEVPSEFLNIRGVHKLLVTYNGCNLKDVPNEFHDHEICRLAVANDGDALLYVKNKTDELIDTAFASSPSSYAFIIDYVKRRELSDLYLTKCQRPFIDLIPNITFDQIRSAVEKNGCNINLLKANEITIELLDLALKTYGRALQHFKEQDRTYERCVIAVSQDGTSIVFVPRVLINLELCKIAVVQNGACINDVIAFIPEHVRNEYYTLAVTSNPYALQYIPDDCITESMCCIAVEMRETTTLRRRLSENRLYHPVHCVLDFIPERFLSNRIYRKYLLYNSYIAELPRQLKNKDFLVEILRNNIDVFGKILNEFIDRDMCLFVVKSRNKAAIGRIPSSFIDHSLFFILYDALDIAYDLWEQESMDELKIMCESNKEISKFVGYLYMIRNRSPQAVPDIFKTNKVMMLLHENIPFEMIDDNKYKTLERCISACMGYGGSFEYVPEPMRTYEVCVAAVSNTGWILKDVIPYIPVEKLPEIYKIAVKNYGYSLKYIPIDDRTEELCEIALQNSSSRVLEYVPDKYKTRKRCIESLSSSNHLMFSHLPAELRTKEFIQYILSINPKLIHDVPTQ